MILTKGSKAMLWLGALCTLQLAGMLVFRAFWYADIPIAPEDAYGLADIIELFLGVVFLLLLGIAMLSALILFIRGARQTRIAALGLVLVCVLLFIGRSPLRELVVRSIT